MIGRPKETTNKMRTRKEKEKIVKEYLNGNKGYKTIGNKYNISNSLICYWSRKYKNKGIEGLKSKTGTKINSITGRPKKINIKEERLKREIIKLENENARLKKGYLVKGVGAKKEYITTQEESTK